MFATNGWYLLIYFIYVASIFYSQDLKTALHLAAIEGHAKVLSFLLEYGANVNTVDLVS
jgi:ankyrin repeat protein